MKGLDNGDSRADDFSRSLHPTSITIIRNAHSTVRQPGIVTFYHDDMIFECLGSLQVSLWQTCAAGHLAS